MSKSHFLFSKEKLKSRMDRIVADWPARLSGLDAVLLVTGSEDDLLTDYRIAVHFWLFGLHFTRTVMVLQKEGRIIILTNSAKLDYLRKFQGEHCVLVERPYPYTDREDTSQFKYMLKLLRGHRESRLTLGTLHNEIPGDDLARNVFRELPNLQEFVVEDCTRGISGILVKKDDDELRCIKRCSNFVSEVMEKMQARVRAVIEGTLMATNAEVHNLEANLTFKICMCVGDLSHLELL